MMPEAWGSQAVNKQGLTVALFHGARMSPDPLPIQAASAHTAANATANPALPAV